MRGPEHAAEQAENIQEYLARKVRELQERVELAKLAGNTEAHHAIFAQMDTVVDNFSQRSSRIIAESQDEAEAKEKIRTEFSGSLEEINQHGSKLGADVSLSTETVSAEVDPDDFESINGETLEVEGVLEVNNALGVEVLVKNGATFRVYGDLSSSVVRVEPGGNFELKGTNEDSDVIENFVEVEDDKATGDTLEEQLADVNVSIPDAPEATPEVATPETVLETTTETPVLDPKSKLESLESDLGYLYLDPSKIFENLEPADIEQLKTKMAEHRVAGKELEGAKINLAKEEAQKKPNETNLANLREKVAELQNILKEKTEAINSFYREKITLVLDKEERSGEIDEEALGAAAERINAIVLETISLEAARLSVDSKLKTMGKQMLKSAPLMIGASIAIGSLGLALPVTGLLAGSTSWVIRRMMAGRSKNNAAKDRLEHRAKIDERKDRLTTALFSDIEGLRKQLSGHISNALRQQTSERAIAALASIERVDSEDTLTAEQLGEVNRELYLSALTQIDAKYPDIDKNQRHNMAINLAMNLSSHQRTQSEATERLAKIKTEKPGLYKIIEKYNLLSATGRADEPPADMTEEEKKVWGISKYDLLSFGIGGGIGMAVRTTGIARVALGALGGGALGYVVGEELERKSEGKAFKEIDEMITQAETLIQDLSFPAEDLDRLRSSRRIVQARLETGILNNNPLLKSRAENFIDNFQRVELANQNTIESMLATLEKNAQAIDAQVQVDVARIEKATKRRRLVATIGGTIAGAAAGYFGADLSKKALDGLGDVAEDLGIKDDIEGFVGEAGDIIDDVKEKVGIDTQRAPEPVPVTSTTEAAVPAGETPNQDYDGSSAWKGETDPWKTGRMGVEADPEAIQPENVNHQADTTAPAVPETPPLGHSPTGEAEPTSFSDKIDSAELSKGSDSIWRSAKAIFIKNAEALGYKGDPAGLDKWAETQTANAVAELNESQGGNLTDLVHDGDMVHMDKDPGGTWHLRLEESSGIEASHLSDTNVDKFFDGTKFEGDVEHAQITDPRTGDQYWEIKSGEDVYKVYDWDRDGRPNIMMPDGSSTEMTVEDMKAFFQEKNIAFTQSELDVAAAGQRFEQYVGNGGGQYESGMYQIAQGDPAQATALLQHVMESNDSAQIEAYLSDHLKTAGFSANKANIFLATLRDGGNLDKTLGGALDVSGGTQALDNLRSSFDSSVKTSYDSLNDVHAEEWHPIEIKGEYYLAYKYHEGTWPFRSDHYYLSNGSVDASGSYVVQDQLDGHAMEDYFGNNKTSELASHPGEGPAEVEAKPPTSDSTPEPSVKTSEDSKPAFREVGGTKVEKDPADFKPVKAVGPDTGPDKDLGMPQKGDVEPATPEVVPVEPVKVEDPQPASVAPDEKETPVAVDTTEQSKAAVEPQKPPIVKGDPHSGEPRDLFEEAADKAAAEPQARVEDLPSSATEAPIAVEASPEDLDAALAVLGKGLEVDGLTLEKLLEKIDSMDDQKAIINLGNRINSLISVAENNPAQEHTLRGFQYVHHLVDAKLVELNSMNSILQVLSAGEQLDSPLTIERIATMDNMDALDGLRKSAENMMKVISSDKDLVGQTSDYQRVIAAIDKRIIDLKA